MQALFSGSLQFISWLINYTIDFSILICLIFVIRFIVAKRQPAWWSYSLWLILLVIMLIPSQLKDWLNISNFFKFSADNELFSFMFPVITVEATPVWQQWIPLDRMLIFVWLTGAIVLGIYIISKNARFWTIVKNSSIKTNDNTLDLLDQCKDRLNIHQPVDIIITDNVKSPALFGYFHPRLLLPGSIYEKLNIKELTYVFMHELGHLKRHDIAVTWLMTIFLIIHWFNPLAWLAFYQMRIDQESACDELVLSRLRHHESIEYGNAILAFLERYCQNRQLPSMAGIMENKTQMKRRLIMIANYKKYSKKMTTMAVALLLATGLIFFTIIGSAQDTQMQTKAINTIGNVSKSSDSDLAPGINYIVKPPEFPGGVEALQEWLALNMKYPEEAAKQGIQGTVVVEFTVDKDGKLSNVTIVEQSYELLNKEAIRLILSMPNWTPADKIDVKNAKVVLPIKFILR